MSASSEEVEELPDLEQNDMEDSVTSSPSSESGTERPVLSQSNVDEEDSDAAQQMNEDDLISLPSSPARREGEENVEGYDTSNVGESEDAVETPSSDINQTATERIGGPVRSFRTRVDEDGEIVFEFGSDEDEDEEEDPDYNPGGSSTGRTASTSQPISQQSARSARSIVRNIFGGVGNRVRSRHRPGASDQEIPSQSNTVALENYLDFVHNEASTSRAILEEQSSGLPSTNPIQTLIVRRPRKRKQRKPKKKKAAKKAKLPKVSKPRAPPKPLKPLVIYEDVTPDGQLKLSSGVFQPSTITYKIPINYHSPDTIANSKRTPVSQVGFKIGEIRLSGDELNSWTARNKDELLETFPGLIEFTIFVENFMGSPTTRIIRLKTERKLSEEESASRSVPQKLARQAAGRSVIFILNQAYCFHFDTTGIPYEMFSPKGLGNKHTFCLDFAGFDEESKQLKFDVKLLESAILGDHKLDDINYSRGLDLLNVFSHFFGIDPPLQPLAEETHKKEDIAWFYGQLKKYHSKESLPTPEYSLQPTGFAPVLRSYQKDAVKWMLFKEGVLNNCSLEPQPSSSKDIPLRLHLIDEFLRQMYVPVNVELSVDNKVELKPAFYNPYVGYVCWKKPTVPSGISGGMLCDEMGLGKTVEIICLILLNQKPQDEDEEYYCKVKSENETDLESRLSDDTDESIISEEEEGRKSRKRIKKPNKLEANTSINHMHHPRLRKRKLSPCEFATEKANVLNKLFKKPSEQESTALNEEDINDSTEIDDQFSGDDEEFEDIDDEQSDTDIESPKSQKIHSKSKSNPKTKLSKSKQTKAVSKETGTNYNIRHPRLKRRRMSPCEFAVENSSEVEGRRSSTTRRAKQVAIEVIAELVEGQNYQNTASTSSSTSPSPKTKARKMSTSIDAGDKPLTTYQGVKQIYDQVLRGYSETAEAKVVPRFHGTFFDTNIRRRACFECICGGYNDDDQRQVLTCTTCDSSQHAECVGLDPQMQKRMLHRNEKYLCPHCAAMESPYPAKTTLIVTPNSISYQWINEIQRHVKNQKLNILYYKGVTTHGYIPPAKLAEYDIIITSYTVLSSELSYVDLPHCNSENARQFRNAKRFLTIPSPLPSVLWWRVCLDEAQMVEGINTKISMMAMKIHAIHRWCVTGTPINHGLQDLFGLFAFLGVQPISIGYWWEKLVQDPFHRKNVSLIYEIFGQLIWRTSKSDVLDQLGIPPQTEMSHWLRFSPVESHFYKQQYEICSNKILGKISRLRQTASNTVLETRLSNLDRQTVQSLIQPFLELRQACCHPQMVKGQLISLQKGTLTMEELLSQLVKKTSLQCAEDHRLIVAAMNGIAGIYILQEAYLEASEKYREVLQSAEKNKSHFHTDSLQLLHSLENLADLLDRHHDGVPFTLRDDSLRQEAEVLKKKYMEKYLNGVKAAKEAVTPLSQAVEQLYDEFQCKKQSWWAATLIKASSLNKMEDLITRIKDDLIDHTKKNNSVITLAHKFNDSIGLQGILVESITQMESLRQSVLKGLEDLQEQDPSSFVNAAVCCHLRKTSQMYYKDTNETGFRCKLCRDHEDFLKYESILFKEEKKTKVFRTGRKWQQQKLMGVMATDLTEEERNMALLREEEELLESLGHVNIAMSDEQRRGTWGDSDTERILKLINNFSKLNGLSSTVISDGNLHMKLFECMKKEFRVLRILWRQIYDQVSAVDELSQATTRLQLREENEQPVATSSRAQSRKKPKELKSGFNEDAEKIQNINLLERHELEIKLVHMEGDIQRGKDSLAIHFGQLLYLDTLKKNGYGKTGTSNSDDCPICQNQLGMEWSVLRCGHSYCSDCVKKMCPNTLHTFLCPLCRHAMKYADVSFVDTREPEQSTADIGKTDVKKTEIRGSHSAKIEAIIGTLLSLRESHPGEKAIIFSTWVNVLEIISKALDQNDIPNCLLNKPGKPFQTDLNRFKTIEDIQVLLMPITSGSKGLNIVEASHVLLVEPILNLACVQQAIGRVHRIGQTKPTYVHRYYVKQSIEEQLFEILRTHDVSSDDEGSLTVADLQNLIRSGQNNIN